MIFRIVIYLLKEVTNLRVLMCYIDNSLLNYCRQQQAKSHGANQSLNRFPIKAVADRECKIGPSSAYAVFMLGHSVRFSGQCICTISTCRDKARISLYTVCVYRPTG